MPLALLLYYSQLIHPAPLTVLSITDTVFRECVMKIGISLTTMLAGSLLLSFLSRCNSATEMS